MTFLSVNNDPKVKNLLTSKTICMGTNHFENTKRLSRPGLPNIQVPFTKSSLLGIRGFPNPGGN